MTDLTQPASAAEFIAAGASPADAAALANQANTMAGRHGFETRIEMEVAGRNAPPPPRPAEPAPTTNAQRIEATAAHQDAQLGDSFAQLWQPPTNAYDYQIPAADNATDEQLAGDHAIKEALHAEQLPKFVVDSIATNLQASMRRLANESQAQASARQANDRGRLETMWKGESFESNIALVDELLEQFAAKNPALKDIIVQAAPRLTPLDVDLLLQVARQRAGRR